jgi:uncharacterized protein (DUF952 family)
LRWAGDGRDRSVADFVDPSLESEGFIHCSTVEQFLIPANERFHGRHDLVLLVIAVDRLAASVVYEDCYQSGHLFPHVYGPIDRDAVVAVVDFPCRDDGSFIEPAGLRAHLE